MSTANHHRRDPQAFLLDPPRQLLGTECSYCQRRVVLLCCNVAQCLRDRDHAAQDTSQRVPGVVYALAGCLLGAMGLAWWLGGW